MKISIVTVFYNNPQVGEALDSILAQRLESGDELELVVIDGGSNDETLNVLERYRSRLGVFVSEQDDGIYHGMNKGIERATGDIIGTLNSDDLYQDDRVLATVPETFRESGAQVVYGDLVYVRRNTANVVRYWKSSPYRDGLFEGVGCHPIRFFRAAGGIRTVWAFRPGVPVSLGPRLDDPVPRQGPGSLSIRAQGAGAHADGWSHQQQRHEHFQGQSGEVSGLQEERTGYVASIHRTENPFPSAAILHESNSSNSE